MTVCHCGHPMVPVASGVNVSITPELSGDMLACVACGRPIRLLHRFPLSGRRQRGSDRAARNRMLRAARRRKMATDRGVA